MAPFPPLLIKPALTLLRGRGRQSRAIVRRLFTRFAPFALLASALAGPVHAASLLDYVGECVPFARAASGIRIYGDAWTWWDQADGKYRRGDSPRTGAVIVFARTRAACRSAMSR